MDPELRGYPAASDFATPTAPNKVVLVVSRSLLVAKRLPKTSSWRLPVGIVRLYPECLMSFFLFMDFNLSSRRGCSFEG